MGTNFSRLFVSLDYPLYVVTTASQHECTGCLWDSRPNAAFIRRAF